MSDITWILSQEELDENLSSAKAEGLGAVVLVTAPSWCGPCKQFEPHYKRAAETLDTVRFIAIDLDDNDWVSEAYGVRGVPTCWHFDNQGRYVGTIKVPMGALPFIKELS